MVFLLVHEYHVAQVLRAHVAKAEFRLDVGLRHLFVQSVEDVEVLAAVVDQ